MNEGTRGRTGLFVALAVAVALIVGFGTIRDRIPAAACVGGISLVVAASQEKATLLKELADTYEAARPTVDGRCVDVQVVSKASGDAEQALASGWDATVDGPRPDVWSPASSAWLTLLRQHRASRDAQDIVADRNPSLMRSPLVLAMPLKMAEALGWPDASLGWADVVELATDPQGWARHGHPEWGRFRLGKTNPMVSTSGLHALVASFFAATGRAADLTERDVTDPRVLAYVRAIESAVVHYGETVSTFTGNLREVDERGAALSYVSAIAIEEKQVLDYNLRSPAMPLAAIYPKEGTLVADHPYAVLNVAWVDAAKRAAAAHFLGFLEGAGPQERFRAAGFRDHDGRGGPQISIASGLMPAGAPVTIDPPAPAVLARIQAQWNDVRKRARILMVLDVSGSMEGTKLELMRSAALTALDHFAGDDELGLWSFEFTASELVSVGPLAANVGALGPRRDVAKDRVRRLAASGGTALYATVRASVDHLRAARAPDRINAVIFLTDGRNEHTDRDIDGLLRFLESEDEERRVRVFTIGYGKDADQATLKKIAKATRGAFYDASTPQTIERVFRDVVSNF
ncbi:MAG TPA: substrate-binding and VWA domain-containing protein [Candidatus Limnocylindria bacterium]|nr:substrate-binding and VWA domain-containing protein [Candidatus Limnocylindria bacterium]